MTLIQDYAEGGSRAVDVEMFARSLHVRKMRRMVEPLPGHTLNLPYYWLNKYYGHLRQGKRLLVSSCDFLQLGADEVPLRWRVLFKSLGSMRAFRPRPAQEEGQGTRKTRRESEASYKDVTHS